MPYIGTFNNISKWMINDHFSKNLPLTAMDP